MLNQDIEKKFREITTELIIGLSCEKSEVQQVYYHYTNVIGLQGIISSNELWATNVKYLNDLTELKYAKNLVNEVLEAKIGELATKDHPEVKSLYRFFNSAKKIDVFDILDVYVVSFCEDGDLLSQWRTYGATDGGFAIGFKKEFIINLPSVSFVKIKYDYETQKEYIVKGIDKFYNLFENEITKIEPTEKETFLDICLRNFLSWISVIMPIFKHPSFKEEKEWRAIVGFLKFEEESCGQLEFRVNRGHLIPYTKLSFHPKRIPLDNIKFALVSDPKLMKSSLELLLRKEGYEIKDIGIYASEVPLRY